MIWRFQIFVSFLLSFVRFLFLLYTYTYFIILWFGAMGYNYLMHDDSFDFTLIKWIQTRLCIRCTAFGTAFEVIFVIWTTLLLQLEEDEEEESQKWGEQMAQDKFISRGSLLLGSADINEFFMPRCIGYAGKN